jgi:hypothetical protein
MHGAAGRSGRDDAARETAASAPRLSMPSAAGSRLRGMARSRLRRPPIAGKGNSQPSLIRDPGLFPARACAWPGAVATRMIVVPGWVPWSLLRARTGKPLLRIRVDDSGSTGQPRRLEGENIENMKPSK